MTIVRLTDEGLKAWPERGSTGAVPTAIPTPSSINLVGLNRRITYAALYMTQPWIFTVVNKLARGIGRLPIVPYAYTNRDTGQKEAKRNHALGQLFQKPFPWWGSASYLKQAVTGSVCIYGHSLCVKQRPSAGAPPNELWPVNFAYVTIVGDEDAPIAYYEYNRGGIRRRFLPEDVVHHMWWGPGGLGVSPLEPLRRTLTMEDAAQRYAISSFSNAARPSGFVRTEQKLQKNDRDQLRQEIEAVHGGPDNAFRIALLTHGLDWTPASHSAQEAAVIEHRKLNQIEACAVYDIPPPMIHILDKATFSNIDEQHRMLYQDTLGPWLTMEEEIFNTQLVEPESDWGNMTLLYDLDEVLRGDEEKRSKTAQTFFQSATRTPNENRVDEGLDPIGDPNDPENPANQIYIPVNMVGTSGEPIPEPTEELQPGAGGQSEDVAQAIAAGVSHAMEHLHGSVAKRRRRPAPNPVE